MSAACVHHCVSPVCRLCSPLCQSCLPPVFTTVSVLSAACVHHCVSPVCRLCSPLCQSCLPPVFTTVSVRTHCRPLGGSELYTRQCWRHSPSRPVERRGRSATLKAGPASGACRSTGRDSGERGSGEEGHWGERESRERRDREGHLTV